jgi:hypothetical protein
MQQQISKEQRVGGVLDAFNGSTDTTAGKDKEAPDYVDPGFRHSPRVRRGAMIGAFLGLVVGLIPLLTTVVFSTIAGALVARASEMHIERGNRPRVRFGRAPAAQ